MSQPKLTELLAGFLNKQAQAHADGLADLSVATEVDLYDAAPARLTDPAQAWAEAVMAVDYFQHASGNARKRPVPPQWPELVADHQPELAVAFALGNFPQMVRDFQSILHTSKHVPAPTPSGRSHPTLVSWAQQVAGEKQYPEMLLALGMLRLTGKYTEAEALVRDSDALVPPEWRVAWKNEKAALAWHQGQTDAAREIWDALEPRAPVLFNRGMAELFAGQAGNAQHSLEEALAKIAPTSSWHHLASLYLTLCR